jgi:hypothetical protein
MSDWKIGDDAFVAVERTGSIPRGIVRLSSEPYSTHRPEGDLVEVECGTGMQRRHEEIHIADLQHLCSACLDPAPSGIRIQGEWMCAPCVEFEENYQRECAS